MRDGADQIAVMASREVVCPRGTADMESDKAEQGFHNLLPCGGVSIWCEDWPAVGEFQQELQASGIEAESYFVMHPEKYQAL